MDKKEHTPLDYILAVFLTICIITTIVSFRMNIESHLFFWSASIVFVSIFIIMPLHSFIKTVRDKEGLFLGKKLYLGIKVATTFLIIIGLYGTVYLSYDEFENYHWLLSLGLLFFIYSIFEGTFSKLMERIKENNNKSKSISNYLGPLLLCILGLAMTLQPFLGFYRVNKQVSLSNLKEPYEIIVMSINQKSNAYNKDITTEKLGVITDKDLIKKFHNETKKLEVKNINFFNIFNYLIMKEKADSYYRLVFIYKSENGSKMLPWRNRKLCDGYIHEIILFPNDRVVVENDELDFSVFRNSETEFYKLSLHDSLIADIQDKIISIDK